MDDYLFNTVEIVRQPKQNFHYRYNCDKKTHKGFITDGNGEECPLIKVRLPAGGHLDEFGNERKFYVLTSVHSYWNDRPQTLSPHVLEKACDGPVKYEFIFNELQEVSGNPLERYWILDKYVIRRIQKNNCKSSLSEKYSHYCSLGLPLDYFKQLKGDVDFDDEQSVANSAELNVCLGFTIFERDLRTNEYRLYRDTIYSNNIYDGDDLNTELCNIKGDVAGGMNIYILGNFKSNHQYTVHFTNAEIRFRKKVQMSKIKIIRQKTLKFVLPKGPKVSGVDEIEVNVTVVVDQSTYKSADMKFCYKNKDDSVLPHKRPRMPSNVEDPRPTVCSNNNEQVPEPNPCEGLLPNSNELPNADEYAFLPSNYDEFILYEGLPPNPDDILSALWDFDNSLLGPEGNTLTADVNENVSRDSATAPTSYTNRTIVMPRTTRLPEIISDILSRTDSTENILIRRSNDKCGNTVFHDAIMNESHLLHLYRQMKRTPHKQLVLNARNNYRENLLHYACLQNKPDCIRALVTIGCGLHEQDRQGRTALHIAIEYKNTECISKLQDLLVSHTSKTKVEAESNADPDQTIQRLIKMFKVYNNQGLTVLHAALLANLSELVGAMLAFCQMHKFDVLQNEVLGNGDSIFHLMAKHNLVDMMELVKQYVPFDVKRKNYRGQTVLDVLDLPSEMLRILNISPSDE